LDWPADLAEVADALGIRELVLAGTSGAGPYLHACGTRLGPRLRKLGVIACMGPPETASALSAWRRLSLAIARYAPWLCKASLPRDPEVLYRLLTRDAPPCDAAVLARIWPSQVAMTAEAMRQGPDAFVRELVLASRPWGFSLEDVRVPVVLWHGSEDRGAPVETARQVAAQLPVCAATFVEGAGHFVHYDRWGDVVESLLTP
jgi:pimeloyl-ACP methyl ester carboxylesterase